MHSSRMRTARLPNVHISVATPRCQYWLGVGPQENKFEQVSSDQHEMSLGVGGVNRSPGLMCVGVPSHDAFNVTYALPAVDRQMPLKTLPSRNFVCRR